MQIKVLYFVERSVGIRDIMLVGGGRPTICIYISARTHPHEYIGLIPPTAVVGSGTRNLL